MASILNKLAVTTQPGRPPAAVSVSPEGALAGAVSASGEPTFALASLPAGALVPGIEEQNLRSPEAVASAIRLALDQASPRTRSVTLVLPDSVVRVFMLDFDTLPARQAEAIPVLRFRLRKMVPFDVEHASVSYQILSQNETEVRVLAAVLPGPVLAEYEEAVRAAGYEPGAVLPSSLAALETVDSLEASMAAHLSSEGLTTTITSGDDLLLYRTLDLPEDSEQAIAEMQRGIAVAAAYFEDKLRMRPHRLYYAGNARRDEFAQWLNEPDLEVVDLIAHPGAGLTTSLGEANVAGVAGALGLRQHQVVSA